MDTNSTKWTKIFEAIHDRAPEVFTEFQFQRRGPGWVAGSAARLDGSTGKSTGKVWHYADRPSMLHDFGGTGGTMSVWDYIATRENLEEPREIARRLYELAGLLSAWRDDTAPPARDATAEAWEALNAVCVGALFNDASQAAEAVRGYLQGRKYAAMFDQANQGVLGCFPGLEAARAAMLAAGVDVEEAAVKNILASLPGGAGTTHPLTIAMHDHRGKLRGLQFRAIKMEHEKPAKYLNPSGMDKAGGLYGTSRRGVAGGPVVLVEGVLDAYAARLHGFSNVAAIGGARMTPGQFKAIDELRASDIYLALDADRAGEAGTLATVLELLSRAKYKIFVVDLAATGAKDLDALLGQPDGADAWKEAQKKAREAGAYLASQAASQVGGLYFDRPSDDVHRAEAAKVVAGFYMAFGKAREAEAGRYLATALEAEGVRELRLSRGDVMQYVAEAAKDAKERATDAEISDFIAKATELQADPAMSRQNVLKRLTDDFTKLQAAVTGQALNFWREPYGENEFISDIATIGKGQRTGLMVDGTEIVLPLGITIIAAPTGHGKTWALINMILNAAALEPDKNFHFFTYEMPRAQIALRFLSAFHGRTVAASDSRGAILRHLQGHRGELMPADAIALEASAGKFYELLKAGRIKIHDAAPDVVGLCLAIREICESEPVGMVAVDYIQLLQMPTDRQRSARHEEVKQICLALKDAAVDTRVPLVLASQFNRDAVKSPGTMAPGRLAEGSDVEKIAALLVGMWNGSVDEEKGVVEKGQLFFKSLKVRDGKPFGGVVSFNGDTGKIGTAVTPPPAPGAIPSNLFTGK
jgi:hypothetical protein